MRSFRALLSILVAAIFLLLLNACSSGAGRSSSNMPALFDGTAAYQHILAPVGFGARPTGSAALQRAGDYIIEQLKAIGWPVETQEFDVNHTRARNISAKRGSGSIVLIGAHYDTRLVADQDRDPAKRNEPVMGANDAVGGVAVLLELARTLKSTKIKHEVWRAFFDAEDNGDLVDGYDRGCGVADQMGTEYRI